jgi:hypothetical protein
MPGGLGPRFALEAGFLIVLAAVAAYARLSTAEIIAVMAGGWLLTAIFEVIAARRERVYLRTGWQPRVEEEEAVAVVEPEPKRRRSWLRRAPKPEAEVEVISETEAEAEARAKSEAAAEARPEPEALAHAAPATDDATPPAEAEAKAPPSAPAATDDAAPPAEAEAKAEAPPSAPAATDEDTGEFELPPPEPRGWFRRRRAEPPALTEADLEPARPSARHVRLIREGPADAVARETPPAEGDDEERKGADTAS